MLTRTGQHIEYTGFAAVGIAGYRYGDFLHNRNYPLFKSFNPKS
jgi:hypothetical protein